MSVSFEKNIAPMFANYQANMNWRLNLTNYDDVKDNAAKIYELISTHQMPPPNYPPLSDAQVNSFKEWMDEKYPK